jgi:hypothetical protein
MIKLNLQRRKLKNAEVIPDHKLAGNSDELYSFIFNPQTQFSLVACLQ